MKIQVARIAASILARRREELTRDATLPTSVRGMIGVHLETPWIAGFWAPAIHVSAKSCARYVDFPVGFAEDGRSWFFPTRQWWLEHAIGAHPPDGTGADPAAHATLLVPGNGGIEYAAILNDGTMKVLDALDFSEEAAWWTRAFGAGGGERGGG